MMDSYNKEPSQQPAAICSLKSPLDAIWILSAVRENMIPHVTRRLTTSERSLIRAGTVWVWEEGETNMKRWTDGRRWGASRVGNGGFLVYTESSESSNPAYFEGEKQTSLIKQTYSTTMKCEEGTKKYHVVAYSPKFNAPGVDLPRPKDLPSLANVKIERGVWPEWEQQQSTNEAYARRPPPGTTLSNGSSKAKSADPTSATTAQPPPAIATIAPSPAHPYTAQLPSPPREMNQPPNPNPPAMPYVTPPYGPRDMYDRYSTMPYPVPPDYNSRYPQYDQKYGGRMSTSPYDNGYMAPRPTLSTPISPAYDGYPPIPRRERSPPPRDPNASAYLQTPAYDMYGRDRFSTSPSMMPSYGGQMDYRSPEIRTFEPTDSKVVGFDSRQPGMGRLPLTPNSAVPDLPGSGPSPRLSIGSDLLNPVEPAPAPAPQGGSGTHLTLPPLRMPLGNN